MLGVVFTSAWRWVSGAIALGVVDIGLITFITKTSRQWWSQSRKRASVQVLVGVNLLIGLVALAILLEASAAITAVTGALGAAALTQWNSRFLAERAAEDRLDERREARDQLSEAREEAARHRAEDRDEARAEWVRARRYAAYESLLSAQLKLARLLFQLSRQTDVSDEGAQDYERAVQGWVEANASVTLYGSTPVRELAGDFSDSSIPRVRAGPVDDWEQDAFDDAAESLIAKRKDLALLVSSEVDELLR